MTPQFHRLLRKIILPLLVTFNLGAHLPAHPGAGIAVDDQGAVYFTDTGRGVWKYEPGGNPELIDPSLSHWFGLDRRGAFANSGAKIGRWHERVTPKGRIPTVLASPEFPMALAPDGSLYYANTFEAPGTIVRRMAAGKETPVAKIPQEVLEPPGQQSYVTGINVAADGTVYVLDASAQGDHVAIRKISPGGEVTVVARAFVPEELEAIPHAAIAPEAVPEGQPVPMTARTYCRGLSVDEDGTIYVAATGCGAVLAIESTGEVRIVFRSEVPWQPTDVTCHDGELYILEYDHTGHDRLVWAPRVRKLDRDGKIQTLVTITRN